ncbi:TetR/AcrR family transcriptional regulator [Nocardioides sp. Bht2]|uniref:TetR/AcrR family transcriptional regulator n=1 Tax=Nocardioides sp. Bht2 TaxID=3392297 RepID=UPI0039B47712
MSTQPVRRTQAERRSGTRTKLLAAAVDSLLESGYAATSVTEIQRRSGAGRGTVQHHFPTKADLMVAATAHVVEARLASTRLAALALPEDADRLEALVDLVWLDLGSPAFLAALELWVAARTDADLKAALLPHERRLMTATATLFVDVLGPGYDDPRTPTLVEFTIDVLTGLTMTTLLTGTPSDGQRQVVLDRWKRALRVLFGQAPPESLVD